MQSLAQEIRSFSRTSLKRQCTRVTSLSGRRIIETWKGSVVTVVEDPTPPEMALGYVPDTSWDLQVGVIKPDLLLGCQDAAHDFSTLRKYKVSHILNVAFGVDNVFPDLFIYKTLSILDHPDTPLLPYLKECCHFIQQARHEKGVVLVHSNAGVSRGPAVVIGYLMSHQHQSFDSALACVRAARPAAFPNPGFVQQLKNLDAAQTTNPDRSQQ
ncbi:dual specificity protein phosphatase 19-like [Phyllopteryx taeniolatus]|uniref:dual specificity protein phosphatase 19-like n=1 Tax=Phyllopteryx taeniolatus TaxID=161469 RepID=UPI002AD49EFF|nr:dual specificity protein phosphatase 19-like [Phyllopteryx taeniolatus]XP_061649006.1 dual specificity protein phosphatase 19-like [Phyllopteryx taeniolatus]